MTSIPFVHCHFILYTSVILNSGSTSESGHVYSGWHWFVAVQSLKYYLTGLLWYNMIGVTGYCIG